MVQTNDRPERQFWRELRSIVKRCCQTWQLVPRSQRLALGGAVLVMGITSAANTVLPLALGRLVDAVNPETHRGLAEGSLLHVAAFFLTVMGVAYFVREITNVLRRYLVENTCTRIDR